MKRLKLPLTEIQVTNRQRLDLGDINELANSLKTNGLIQPIVVNQENRLIAGGRRFAAATSLGWTEIDVVYRETLSEDELHILELEENIQRKDETWQEKCLHIATIHQLKVKTNALDCKSWGQRETGAMLGVSVGNINFNLQIAEKLRLELAGGNTPKEGARFWACDSLSAAWKLLLRDREDQLMAELAKKQAEATFDSVLEVSEEKSIIQTLPTATEIEAIYDQQLRDLLENFGRKKYVLEVAEFPHLYCRVMQHFVAAGRGTEEDFKTYWAQQVAEASKKQVVKLSNRIFQGDSIEFMNRSENQGKFDHVITDIPYGIDMDMLNQQNPHGGMKNIDTVEELHDVEYNRRLIADFFPAAFRCTKEKAFVITWGDQMLWQFMYDCAIMAGFAVQRWPITWVKTSSCMNQCAQFNTTKDTEIAIVCRKKGSTLVANPQTSVITAGRDQLCTDVGHPFAKPRDVWKFLVNMVSIEGQHILEPFMGRGSGVISMLGMNRTVTGVELDQAHYNAALENIKTLHYLKLDPDFEFI